MKKVITYGTFDLFHQGHYNILKRAKALGDYLIVGVTSESYDIERGKLNVRDNLLKRVENVRRTGFADEIIIEEYQGQKLSDIIKYNVDILVLGSDWRGRFDYLGDYCQVIYLERTKNISSTELRGAGHTWNIGVATDDQEDGGIVWESKYVSGVHVESVFSSQEETARQFCEKYELDSWWTDYERFLEKIDIVYIKDKRDTGEKIEKALKMGKYVISDTPMVLEPERLRELFLTAHENGVLLIERMNLVYLRAFHQLVWLTHGGLAGSVVSVKCSISQDHFEGGKSFYETAMHAICAIVKLLGKDYDEICSNRIEDAQGGYTYDMITLKYPRALGFIEIGSGVDIKDELTVIGSKGRITVPGDWWNTGYFEAKLDGQQLLKRYSFNFEGNGFRYLLQELLIMISDKRTECTRLFNRESEILAKILKKIDQRG